MKKKSVKIGILGGTFDPVHRGHIGLARDAIKELGLDEVVLIPAKIQPFKQDRKVTCEEDRFNMLALAVSQDDKLTVSRDELDNEGVSYTYLTLRRLKKFYETNFDEAKIYFICGTDSLLKIETWSNAEELLNSYSYVVGTRPGYRQEELEISMKRIREKHGTEIINLPHEQLDISSTTIRDRLSRGERIDDLVPEIVWRYIEEKGLYREV